MAELFVLQVRISGFTGGPGLNTWCFTSGDIATNQSHVEAAATELRAFYQGMRSFYVNNQTADVIGESKVYDIANGAIKRIITFTPPAQVVGTDPSGGTSRASQAKVRLYTDTVVGRRFLAGGIYFGPISDSAMDVNGNIEASVGTAIQTGLDALISPGGPRLQVWHRPKGKPPIGGAAGDVVAVGVMPVPAVLRSRRD